MSPQDLDRLSAVIDPKALLARCLNNLDFAGRILLLFEDSCNTELAELDQALERNDLEQVSRVAHRLSGACANAAAFNLHKSAAGLRHAATDGSLEGVANCLSNLHGEWERFTAAMHAQPVPQPTVN